jgi:hypothetical protein
MKRIVTALIAGVLAAGAGASAAAADSSPPSAGPSTQTVAQLAKNSQDADATATSTQIKPENTNVSAPVLSHGDSGSVSQSNNSTAAAIAANANELDQTATQTAGSGTMADGYDGYGASEADGYHKPDDHGAPVQSAGQIAASEQDADAWADSKQVKPENTNVSVPVLSKGDSGDVTQSNKSTALGVALNKNDTDQTATQTAGGGSPVQSAAQVAKSEQDADAAAESTQIKPKNTNVSVRVFSPGDNGSVSQKNSSTAAAIAANKNELDQTATQTAGDGKHDGSPKQTAGQVAVSKQDADAWAESKQVEPKNTNVSVRVFSPGDDGDVTQENTSTALGVALNKNDTDQTATQTGGGSGVQAAEQIAKSDQDADASAKSTQIKPKNTNVSVRVFSPGHNGKVSQSNTSKAIGIGANLNDLEQTTTQTAAGGKDTDGKDTYGKDKDGAPVQTAGQIAISKQDADAWAESTQVKPTNTNVSTRVLSPGDNGDVTQENKSTAIALAANKNDTDQTTTQTSGSGYGTPVQAAGQIAVSKQDADAWAESTQVKPSNTNVSARVLDKGHDECHDTCDGKGYGKGDAGDVSQSNESTALGVALNKNDTDQTVTQNQGGGYGDVAVQAAGQIALNKQDAWASAESKQIEPENKNVSVPLFGKGDDGDVSQRNSSTALAVSLNKNDLDQTVAQGQGGGKGGYAGSSPAASEEYDSLAGALALAKPDDGGDEAVSQANKSLAAALSANVNDTEQTTTQSQDGKGDVSVQAAGQLAVNKQDADAKAESFQYGARNENTRVIGPELCKHDSCKPDLKKREHCKSMGCKPTWTERSKRCKPSHNPCRRTAPHDAW